MNRKVVALLLCSATIVFYAAEERQLSVGIFSAKNKRQYQEDRYHHERIEGKDFFGVYDGHCGPEVAQFLKEKLPVYFREAFGSIEDKMKASFHRADTDDFVTRHRAGSTAVVACVDADNVLHCAHVGDSRALLIEKKLERWGIRFATEDHKANRADERKRIEKDGGCVFFYSKAWRVNGSLAVSRAIGDWCMDKKLIIAEPEYTAVPLTEENQFLIVASDGLWDVVTNEEAVSKLQECYAYNKNLNSVALQLAGLAIERGSKDNITVMVVDLLSRR